jgi:peptidoglycan hydrolase CwlO-like protein
MDPEVRAEFDAIRSILRESAELGRATDKRMDRAEKRMDHAEKRTDRAEKRMDRHDRKMEALDAAWRERVDRADQRMDHADKRMDKFDQQLQAMRKLVEAGMKIVSQLAADTRELKRSQKAFLDSLRNAGNGRRHA